MRCRNKQRWRSNKLFFFLLLVFYTPLFSSVAAEHCAVFLFASYSAAVPTYNGVREANAEWADKKIVGSFVCARARVRFKP